MRYLDCGIEIGKPRSGDIEVWGEDSVRAALLYSTWGGSSSRSLCDWKIRRPFFPILISARANGWLARAHVAALLAIPHFFTSAATPFSFLYSGVFESLVQGPRKYF